MVENRAEIMTVQILFELPILTVPQHLLCAFRLNFAS